MRLRMLLWAAIAAMGVHESSLAQLTDITPGELALTPQYCQDVQTINGHSKTKPSPRTGHWINLMGDSFWAMHHYCWALIRIHRAQMPGVAPIVKKGMLQHSVGDYKFVIENTPSDFVLLPEIYTRLGELYVMLDDFIHALESFERAAQLRPDYWPAYVRWAELLLKVNQKAEAKRVVAEGLRRAPDAESLLRMYQRLGGDPSDARRWREAAPMVARPTSSASAPPSAATRETVSASPSKAASSSP